MSRFTDAMRAAGFGTDPEGDRRRREEAPGTFITGDQARYLAERGIGFRGPFRDAITAAVREDLNRRAARILEDARAMTPGTPADRAVPADHPPVPGHFLSYRHGKAGTEVTCECGRWDGWYNGPRSRRRVLDDHADHVAAELSADGPIIVVAERLDVPKELEP